MTEIPKVSRLPLHEQVTLRLRNLLVEGRIAPGAKLNERELCELLQVSRTPLREAIKLLAAEGLVDLLPNRGAVAARLDETAVINTFEVLANLEGLAGELAAQRITDEELAEIRALHYEMLACYTRHNLPGYYELNAKIHTALNLAAKNPVLTLTYRAVNARAQPMRFHTNHDPIKWKRAVADHEQMLLALERRDPSALRDLLISHLHAKRDTVLALMKQGFPFSPVADFQTT